MFETLADAAIYQGLMYKAGKYFKRQLDRRRLLRRIGLAPYTPARDAVGAASLFVLGTAIGAGFALMLTPRTGAELRSEVAERARGLVGKMSPGMTSEAPNIGASARA